MSDLAFSVVIPTHNRKTTLARVLAAYAEQQPADLPFELIVVDDGSTDGSAELLANWRARRFRLRFAVQPNRGPAAARNHALTLAQGRFVLFTGDDIEPAPTLLAEHWRAHQQRSDPATAIVGLTCWPLQAPTTATMRHIDGPGAQQFSYAFFVDGAEYDFRHFYTSNVSLQREFLEREPAAFSTDFPAAAFEDAEFSYRLAHHGMRIFYHQAAVGFHHHPYDARSFFRRQERCGEMAAIFYRKVPQVRKFLDLDALERLALEQVLRPASDQPMGDLPKSAEERLLRLASFFDPLPFAVDELLQPLFRLGYLKGLARAFYPPNLAARTYRAACLELALPAVKRFQQRVCEQHLPYPHADLLALLAQTHPGEAESGW